MTDEMTTYHPNPEINEEISREAAETERIDVMAGFPPRKWQCPDCGVPHGRGHFGIIGCHRCLNCGYVGAGGVLLEP